VLPVVKSCFLIKALRLSLRLLNMDVYLATKARFTSTYSSRDLDSAFTTKLLHKGGGLLVPHTKSSPPLHTKLEG
jgi:hypothetical protein